MAFFNDRNCLVCGTVTKHNGSQCLACQERERKAAEAAWSEQTTDEKLLDLHRRLRDVERGSARY